MTVGHDDGISVFLEDGRPGLHFRLQDAPSPFVISGTWRMYEQGLVLVEISVASLHPRAEFASLEALIRPPEEPPEPPPHIPGSVLRSVSVPELERRTRAALKRGSAGEEELERGMEEARKQGFDIPALYQVPRIARDLLSKLGEESFRPGRQGYSTSLYEWVAKEYLRLARSGSRKILHELAERATEHLGREVSVPNVRDWVHRARELQMLSKGHQGKVQADPGPALRS